MNESDVFAKTDGLIRENRRIQEENQLLQKRIKKLESTFRFKKGAVELELLLKDKIDLENENKQSLDNFQKKVGYLQEKLEEKEHDLSMKSQEILKLQNEFDQIEGNSRTSFKLKKQMARVSEQSQQELNDSRRIIRQKEEDIENLSRKLKKSWFAEDKLQKKIK